MKFSTGADPGAAAPPAQGVEGEKSGRSSGNKLDVVTCPFCHSPSGQWLDGAGLVADEQVNSSAFVHVQEGVCGGFGQGGSLQCQHHAGRESPAKQRSTVGQAGTAGHSPVPWHVALLVIAGIDTLLASGCRNLVFWAPQRLCLQLLQGRREMIAETTAPARLLHHQLAGMTDGCAGPLPQLFAQPFLRCHQWSGNKGAIPKPVWG